MHHKDHSGHQLVCTFNTCVRGNTSPDQQEALVCTECVCVCVYLLRKEFPNALSFLKGFLGSTTRALPGMTPSFSPYITAMKPSVVGSGPIRIPGKSCSNRYLRREREVVRGLCVSVVSSEHRRPLTQFPSLKKSEKGRKRWKAAAASPCPLTSCHLRKTWTSKRKQTEQETTNDPSDCITTEPLGPEDRPGVIRLWLSEAAALTPIRGQTTQTDRGTGAEQHQNTEASLMKVMTALGRFTLDNNANLLRSQTS